MNNVLINSNDANAKIPEKYRPSKIIWGAVGVVGVTTTGNVSTMPRCTINTDGTITIQIAGANTNATVRGQISWIV